jgi:arsenate reductase
VLVSAGRSLPARCLSEGLGAGFLLAVVVGSGIMAERLADDVGLQLFANSTATALALVALILTFGPVSGAHLNPAVTLAELVTGRLVHRAAGHYIVAQVVGGCLGTIVANLMFELPAVELSTKDRLSAGTFLAEVVVATFGLLTVIFGVVRSARRAAVPFAVGAYIGAAYWFTSSTSVANPAATVARTLSDTFAGIAPASAPGFIAAQLLGAGLAVAVARVLFPEPEPSLEEALG